MLRRRHGLLLTQDWILQSILGVIIRLSPTLLVVGTRLLELVVTRFAGRVEHRRPVLDLISPDQQTRITRSVKRKSLS